MAPRTFLIAASGSGGHLMPALYIANELRRRSPESRIEFVGSGRPLEREILGPAGYQLHTIDVVGLKSRGLGGVFQFVARLPRAIAQTNRLFGQLKPDVVIGVGGYVTVLPVIFARLRGIPSWIHEAERKLGLANWVLSFFASRVSCAFESTVLPRPGRKVVTGHPVRPELAQFRSSPKPVTSVKNLLVLGGSQGAQAVDDALRELVPWFKEFGLALWHQCREANAESLAERYKTVGLEAQLSPFIHDLPQAYRWADLIVSRSGAGMVMELGVVNLPCILVPFPFAQARHQLVNAEILVSAGKALLVEEGAGFVERLRGAIETLLEPARYKEMRELPPVDRGLDAAAKIAAGIATLHS